VDKFPVVNVNPDVALFSACFEKYQVAEFEGFLCNGFACFSEQFGRARQLFIKYIAIGYVDKARAIDACFAEAT